MLAGARLYSAAGAGRGSCLTAGAVHVCALLCCCECWAPFCRGFVAAAAQGGKKKMRSCRRSFLLSSTFDELLKGSLKGLLKGFYQGSRGV